MILERARQRLRERDDPRTERGAIARRLVVGFILIVLVTAVFFFVLPIAGIHLPPILPLLCYAAIAVGTLLNMPEAPKPKDNPLDADARPITCPGPGHMRSLRPPTEPGSRDDTDDRDR